MLNETDGYLVQKGIKGIKIKINFQKLFISFFRTNIKINKIKIVNYIVFYSVKANKTYFAKACY